MPISYENLNTLSQAGANTWAEQSYLDKGLNMAAAIAVDVGTSLYNSVVPESWEVGTRNVLQDLGAAGAVEAYDMNRDTVETLSFIGGMFIPGIAATKIAQGVRAGLKGTSWLSDARHMEDIGKFNKLIEDGQQGTQQYKAVRNSIYMRGQASNLMDVAAAEAAIGLSFNAHPFMEDYWQNPLENMATSMLIGGAIGGGISALVSKNILKQAAGTIESAAVGTVAKEAGYQAPILADSMSSITALEISAQRLDNIAASEVHNQLTRNNAKSWALSMREQQGELFNTAASPEIRALATTDAEGLATIRKSLQDPKFFGVDEVGFYKPAGTAFESMKGILPKAEPEFNTLVKSGPMKGQDVFDPKQFYSQELGGFVSKAHAEQLANVADMYTPADIGKKAKALGPIRATNGFDPLAATADLEAGYLSNLDYFAKAPAKDLARTTVVAGDLPAMNGWVSGMKAKQAAIRAKAKLTPEDLEDMKTLSTATLTIKNGQQTIKATAEQAQLLYLDETGKRIHQAVKEGMPREIAATRFNTTPEMVDLVTSKPDGMLGLYWANGAEAAIPQMVKWANPESIPQAFSANRRLLQVGATESKMTGYAGSLLLKQHDAIRSGQALAVEQKAALESMDSAAQQRVAAKTAILDEQYSTINRLWIETSVLAGKSKLLSSMHGEVVDAAEVKVLREGLQQMVNGKGGNPLYQSADFVTSMMGRVGQLITGVGDKRAHLANMEFERLATPISTNFKLLINDPAARTQFAMLDNFRQSTKGLLKYDKGTRQFLTKSEDGSQWIPAGGPKVTLDVVHDSMVALDQAAADILENQKTLNRVKGLPAPSDIGTWIPSVDLRNKHRAFVVNHDDGTIKMLVANTADDLKTLANEYTPASNETIMTAAEVGQSKIANMSDELMDNVIKSADVGKMKKGIGLAAPDVSGDRLAEIVNGLRDRINYQATNFVETSLQDVMQKLDYMSSMNQTYSKGQASKGFLSSVKELAVKDTAADMKDLLLGKNPVHRSAFMQNLNQTTSSVMQVGINAFSKGWELVKPTFTKAGSTGDYDGFMKALEAQGVKDPFAAFHEAARPLLLQRAKNSGYSVNPDRLINGGNAIAATLALRFGELAQPLVNMMSLPILSISTISRSVKAANMTSPSDLLAASPIATMMAGVRRAHSAMPENKNFLAMFEKEGLLQPVLSEADEVLKLSRMGSGGIVGGVEKALDSKFIQLMSKPADVSETMVRKYSLMTGVELGRKLYGPGASDRQIALFARDFMKQSIGNYSTSQRPMMFQGSLGAAAGLFQTYMLTFAQNMYRHVELGDYKGLGKTMLAQAGIFGVGSLPGFHPISQAIGEHFSDEHYDLVSGTYRALPDGMANLLIYGMPSNIAPALHTRGDVSPRVPGGVTTLVAPSMVGQALETLYASAKSLGQADATVGQSFMEALSMQSVSRPIARAAELVTGTAVTRAGNQVAGNEEVWSFQGIAARVFSTRTLQESKVREATHLNSYYGAIDSENRKAVLQQLRTSIRSGQMTAEKLDDLAFDYMRVGTPQGFRQAVNQAFMETENPGMVDLTATLRKSPLMNIVEDID